MERLTPYLLAGAFVMVLGWSASPAHAIEPSVRLVGPVGQVRTGTIWPIEIRLDTGGVNINAAEVQVIVTGEGVEVTRLGRESSIFTLWPEGPSISGATAKFVGGRPGGLVAVDAIVGTVFVVARQPGSVKVRLLADASGLYRHDGVGTKVPVTGSTIEIQVADDLVPAVDLVSMTHPDESSWGRTGEIDVAWTASPNEQFSYRLSNDIGTVPDDDLDAGVNPLRFTGLEDGVWYFTIKRRLPGEAWSPIFQRRFLLDRTPPEPFSLQRPDPRTVGGHTALTWTALDRTAGVVAYRGFVGGKTIGTVSSPLPLQPAWRGQRVQIVAIDAAGNERLSEAWIDGRRAVPMPWWAWILIAGVVCGLVYGLGRLFRRE